MKRISARSTFVYKKVVPTFWFGFLAFVIVMALFDRPWPVDLFSILGPLLLAGIGFLVMRVTLWNLADEVSDYGDYLVVKKGSGEKRVALADIINVSVSVNTHPTRITMRLAKHGRFGEEVAFLPVARFSWNPFAKNHIAEDLIVRVDRARSKRAV